MNTLDPTVPRTDYSPLQWAKAACDGLRAQYPCPEKLPPENRWHYHQGVFLYGMLQVWEQTGEEAYLTYPKEYVDKLIDADGNFYFARDELDAIMPGLLLFTLDKHYGEARYRIAADKLRQLFATLNRTSEGGFWHKDKYPYQMWLDGLYMGGVFALKYAEQYEEPSLIDMVLYQEKLMRKYMKDEQSGLLYHAWDESRSFPWADAVTGCSPEFWGRSLGWYGMALADFLDHVPAAHSGRKELEAALKSFVLALIRCQDQESGLWYQVVDKGGLPDNWLETSGSSLFVYTIAKAVKHGCVDKELLQSAVQGYQGLLNRVRFNEEGHVIIPDICIGTSAGDYNNYVTRPVKDNDLHGVGAFILACAEMEGGV
ncbi:glycoside hydrolase family 105 protein [Paenibacillus sp. J2TS4]|uniref:glycoside hydrolase family 88/105 protein n=1 Tax=Paenibacillus sp. J2TS4 TaxID=2807194 RepID=UPI001B0CBA03|nr:glycoside hydrolase family 88 protein [Paenibacillus sp. J2TS4]GIP35782.1 unsaturated rhamnogalacturonyl hydrolase YteR [Paenibacillus sp. J2TS4]